MAVVPFKEIQASTAGGWSGNADNPLFTNVDGKLFFRAGNNGADYELYVSTDGTAAGTSRVLDINSGTGSSNPIDFVSLQGKLFFTANDGINGRELWVSDGTSGGTSLFANINTAAGVGGLADTGNNFTVFNGKLYFTANDGANGTELWVTDGVDGTLAHTHMVVAAGQTAGVGSSTISNLTVVNDSLYFAGITATKNLWKTDGITDPVQVSTVPSAIGSMVNFNGTLFFSATGNGLGQELWMSDGTSWGTTQFADQVVGSGGINPAQLTVVNNYLFYTNNSTIYGTDGVSAPAAISAPGASSFSGIKFLTESGGRLFFGEATTAGTLGTNTPQMWMYDPANGLGGSAVNITGTTQTGLNGTGNIGLWSISNANGTPYFSYSSSSPWGWEVFDYNIGTGVITAHEVDTGTTAGTNAMYPSFANGSVFWTGVTSTYGRELYKNAVAPWELPAQAPVNTLGSLGGPYTEDTAGALTLGTGLSVTDPDGDVLNVKLVASAGFSDISVDGTTYHKVLNLSGTAATINASLANLTGHLKANFSGNAEIDITTTDPSGWSDTDRMFATVTPVPDAPTLTLPISAGTIAEDANNITPLILGSTSNIFKVFDADPGDVLTLTATVGQGFAGVNLTSSAGTFGTSDTITGTWDYINAQIAGNKIFVKTQADFNGTAQLLFTVSDGVNPPVSGTYSKVVTAVNDAPVDNNVPIGVQTNLPLAGGLITEDTPVVFSTANGNLITISDVDLQFGTPTADYTVDLTTAKAGIGDTGTVQVVVDPLHPLTSLVGNGTSHVTLTGTLDNINWALDGMAFVPYAQNYVYTGSSNAALQIVTNDHANIGTGNVLSDTDTINFTVQPVPDAPVNTVNTINVPANASTTISLAGGLSVHDGDVGDTLFVDVKAGTGVTGLGFGSGTTFAPEYVFMGTESYLNTFLSGLKAQVAAGFSGPATVLITTTDLSGLSVTDTMTITSRGQPLLLR